MGEDDLAYKPAQVFTLCSNIILYIKLFSNLNFIFCCTMCFLIKSKISGSILACICLNEIIFDLQQKYISLGYILQHQQHTQWGINGKIDQ